MEKNLWAQAYPADQKPTPEQIEKYVSSPYWNEFIRWIQSSYSVNPSIEYSIEAGNPGWNIKYRKSSKALCTIYPDKGKFIVLVVVPPKMEPQAEQIFPGLSETSQSIFRRARPMAMGRWLMLPVESGAVIEDAKKLILLRVLPRFQEEGK